MKKKRYSIILTALFFSMVLVSHNAQPVFADDALPAITKTSQNLVTKLQGITSMQARFKQLVAAETGVIIDEVTGDVYVKRPHYFRWDSGEPTSQRILVNQDRLYIYDIDLDQVVVRPLGSEVGSTPALLLSGDPKKIVESFDVSERADGDYVLFVLKPKTDKSDSGEGALFANMTLAFEDSKLISMGFEDHLGQMTTIDFSNIDASDKQDNKDLPDSLFATSFPEDVDVIEEL